jgi:uncharacterized protein (DUF1697 family)
MLGVICFKRSRIGLAHSHARQRAQHVGGPAGRHVYWLCRKLISKSDFSLTRLEKTLTVTATLRNATTVRKIAATYS